MKPWQRDHLLLEEQLESLIHSQEHEDVKKCLLVLIELCKDIDNTTDEQAQLKFWQEVSTDIEDVLNILNEK